MKIKFSIFIAVLFCISASFAFADTTIGNGFSCDGSSIIKNGLEVPYTEAKSTLQKTISKLKNKLSTATTGQDKLKKKLTKAKKAKKGITACFNGTLNPDQVDPVFSNLASGTGTYTGMYSGLVGGFLPISGNMTVQFILNGTDFSGSLSADGNLGSALNGESLSFGPAPVGGIGFPAQFMIPDTFVGNVVVSFTQAGHISISNDDASKAFGFEGDLSGTTISATLSGVYSGVEFSGDATLNK